MDLSATMWQLDNGKKQDVRAKHQKGWTHFARE